MGENLPKTQDAQLAQKLWPEYLRTGGNCKAVSEWSQEHGCYLSRTSIARMAEYFGWLEKLQEAQRITFTNVTGQASDLSQLLNEVTEQKNAMHKIIVASPGDKESHKLYGDYIGQIMNIRKLMIAAKQVDKDQLLLDALNGIVEHFKKCGELESAQSLMENLESIAEKVKEKWQLKN